MLAWAAFAGGRCRADRRTPVARILIVDDDLAFRFEIRKALVAKGHAVIDTDTPEREHVKSAPKPELIIIDLNMPVMDGDVLASFFVSEWQVRTPIYLWSAGSQEELAARAESVDVAGFFSKVGSIEELVAEIEAVVPPEAPGDDGP
jgi:DNA-binding NarL/FixJ family response regulator